MKIYSGNVTQEWEKGKKLIVSVGYYYFLDLLLGYHFNSFRLNVFDMNTHEYLFSVVFKKEGMPTDSAVIHAVIDTLQRKLKGEAIQKLVY